jgi:intracellular sulfur oxidation DsrE/DsrF family protein
MILREAIELVVHGPALKTFLTAGMDPQLKAQLTELQGQGLAFGACGNTMKAFSLTLEQLPPGAQRLPQGGVVRIMELVEQGYIYLRP